MISKPGTKLINIMLVILTAVISQEAWSVEPEEEFWGRPEGLYKSAEAACGSIKSDTYTVQCPIAFYPETTAHCHYISPEQEERGGCTGWVALYTYAYRRSPQYVMYDDNKSKDKDDLTCKVGNPIDPASGEKLQAEPLIEKTSILSIPFGLYYASLSQEKWRHTYTRTVTHVDSLADEPRVRFDSSTFGSLIEEPPETANNNASFGKVAEFGQVMSPAVSGVGPAYSTRDQACVSGWASLKSNYHYPWVANSIAEYIGQGRCKISENGVQKLIINIYSLYSGRRYSSQLTTYPQEEQKLVFARHNGSLMTFKGQLGGGWVDITNSGARAEVIYSDTVITGYKLHTPDDEIEIYNAKGLLQSISELNGKVTNLYYNATTGLLETVTNNLGASLSFGYEVYDTDNNYHRLASVSTNYLTSFGFRYDAISNNLQFIDMPDGGVRQYHYEDITDETMLTGITDERNIRYASWAYYIPGIANFSKHGNNLEQRSIAYLANGTREVTTHRTSVSGVVTDLVSHMVTNTSGGKRQIIDATDPNCTNCAIDKVHFDYNAQSGFLESITDHGVTTVYENYNTHAKPEKITTAKATPLEQVRTYTYDSRFNNKISSVTEPSVYPSGSKVTSYTYDASGNLTDITINGFTPGGSAVTQTTQFQYQGPFNQLSQIDGPQVGVGDLITLSYYPDSELEGTNRARLKSVADANNQLLRNNIIYETDGQIKSEDRLNKLHLDYIYYPGNRWLKDLVQTDTLNQSVRTTRWTYLATGEVASVTLAAGTVDASTLNFTYDEGRRLTRITDALGNYMEYKLDSEGNVESESLYDVNNVLSKTLTQTFNQYNSVNTFSQLNESQNINYNSDGTLDTISDANNTLSKYEYDVLKRLTRITENQGGINTDTANVITEFAYDVQNNMTSVTAANNAQTNYLYDDLGNLLSRSSPDTGTVNYQHDTAGNITQATDAKGQVFSYSYDSLNRLASINAPGTEDDVGYIYDNCAQGTGQLCEVTRNGVTTSYSYNAFGEVTALSQGIGAITQTQHYAYDTHGRLSQQSYPNGDTLSYQYDLAGNLTRIDLTQGILTTNLVSNAQYLPFGALKQASYGNGLSYTSAHLSNYQLDWLKWDLAGANIWDRNYGYNTINLVNGFTDSRYTNSQIFTYDELERLDTASSSDTYGVVDYGYDKVGNRTSLSENALTTSYGYDANSNRLSQVNASPITTDANGNITHNGLYTIEHTTDNRVKRIVDGTIEKARYVYNGLGQRIQKTTATQTINYLYGLNGELLAEFNAAQELLKLYIYFNGQPMAFVDKDVNNDFIPDATNALVRYIHNDHLGTPKIVTDNSGVIVWSATAKPFGYATVNADVDGDGVNVVFNLRQPGQYFDVESGFYYNYFRYYDPSTGRYITSDPIGLNGGVNTYAYALNNPLYYTDPDGLNPIAEIGVGAGILYLGSVLLPGHEQRVQSLKDLIGYLSENADDASSDDASDAGEGGQCDADAPHDKDRRALNDLIKDLTLGGRRPLSSDDADAAIDIANDLGIPGVRDDRGTDHWRGGPHIHIPGTGIGHIPARR